MRKIVLFSVFVASVLFMASCHVETAKDLGPRAEQTFVVKPFEQVVVKGGMKVVFVQGDKIGVSADGLKKMLADLKIVSDGKTLTVSDKEDVDNVFSGKVIYNNLPSDECVVTITAPSLSGVSMSGSGVFSFRGKINADDFQASLNGSGDMVLDSIVCQKAQLSVLGSGDMSVAYVGAGRCDALLTGSGDLKAKLHGASEAGAELIGSGDIDLTLVGCGHATAHLTGSGDIALSGSVKKLDKTTTGSGEISISRLAVGK